MIQPDLGKKIADLRKAKGLTQEELVEKCNISVRTLQRIESGEGSPRSYTLRIIFSALDYSQVDSNEISSNSIGSIISFRLEQFYRYFIDLFNLKTNTMKKISILTVIVTLIVLGITAINSVVNAQKSENKQSTVSNTSKAYSTPYEMAWSNVKCGECFNENDRMIGRDVKFDYNGIHIDVKLISLNKMTREFNVGFAKGILREQRVEISMEKFLLDDKVVNYTADKIEKSDNNIVLFGNAKLSYNNDSGVIASNEILITIK
jgi:transcriptional regulator with XRE-family HTH domain